MDAIGWMNPLDISIVYYDYYSYISIYLSSSYVEWTRIHAVELTWRTSLNCKWSNSLVRFLPLFNTTLLISCLYPYISIYFYIFLYLSIYLPLLGTEKQRGNMRLFFLAGNRVSKQVDQWVEREKQLNKVLQVEPSPNISIISQPFYLLPSRSPNWVCPIFSSLLFSS